LSSTTVDARIDDHAGTARVVTTGVTHMRYEDASQMPAADHNAPVARPDVDVLPAGSYGPATGNALTGQGTT
jgi:hypothetical protein